MYAFFFPYQIIVGGTLASRNRVSAPLGSAIGPASVVKGRCRDLSLPHALRHSRTTFSTCGVWGNMSTGCTFSTL